MPDIHVLDASAVLKLVLAEPHSEAFRGWYGSCLDASHRFVAPSLLPYELANALWSGVAAEHRQGERWTRDVVRDLLIAIDLDTEAWARIDPWHDRLTSYDAAYLALAVAHDATLVTYDARLSEVAREAVQVLAPGKTDGSGPS